MESEFSTILMNSRGTSSGSTSRTGFMPRWGHEAFEHRRDPADLLFVAWDSTHGALRHAHIFQADAGTTGGLQYQEEILTRLLCHVLLDRMPKAGLADVLDSLASAYDFYQRHVQPPERQLHTGREFPAQLEGR